MFLHLNTCRVWFSCFCVLQLAATRTTHSVARDLPNRSSPRTVYVFVSLVKRVVRVTRLAGAPSAPTERSADATRGQKLFSSTPTSHFKVFLLFIFTILAKYMYIFNEKLKYLDANQFIYLLLFLFFLLRLRFWVFRRTCLWRRERWQEVKLTGLEWDS